MPRGKLPCWPRSIYFNHPESSDNPFEDVMNATINFYWEQKQKHKHTHTNTKHAADNFKGFTCVLECFQDSVSGRLTEPRQLCHFHFRRSNYLFLAMLGLRCCVPAFSRGCSSCGLVSSCGVRASRCRGFSCCDAWGLGAWTQQL